MKVIVVTTSQINCAVVDQTKQPNHCLPLAQLGLGDPPTQPGKYQLGSHCGSNSTQIIPCSCGLCEDPVVSGTVKWNNVVKIL